MFAVGLKRMLAMILSVCPTGHTSLEHDGALEIHLQSETISGVLFGFPIQLSFLALLPSSLFQLFFLALLFSSTLRLSAGELQKGELQHHHSKAEHPLNLTTPYNCQN